MRITFDNLSQVNTENTRPERSVSTKQSAKASASYRVAFDGKDRVGFGIGANTAERIKEAISNYEDSLDTLDEVEDAIQEKLDFIDEIKLEMIDVKV